MGIITFRFPDHDEVYNTYPKQRGGEEIFDKFAEVINKMGSTMSDSSATIYSSSTIWISATIIVCAIAIALVWLMKKENRNILTANLPIQTGDRNKGLPISYQQIGVTEPPDQPVVSSYQIPERAMENLQRFSHTEILKFTGNLTSLLGSCGYGRVYKGTLPNRHTIAVKVLNDHKEKNTEKQFMAEVGILGRTRHVNLVKLYGFCFDPQMRALVYEYMENGSLDKLLFNEKKPVKWEKLVQIAIGIAKGLAYLHEDEDCQPKIIHSDIKPEYVLLDSNLNPKVEYFGLDRLCNKESTEESCENYVAPELLMGSTPTNKSDVYSFGLLLFEIIARRRNYLTGSASIDGIDWLPIWMWKLYIKGKLSNFFSEYCGIEEENKLEAVRVLTVGFLCVHHDPTNRPTMSNVVTMLEGNYEINQPLYPFDDSESSVKPNGLISRSKEKSNATSTSKVPHRSHSKLLNKSLEID